MQDIRLKTEKYTLNGKEYTLCCNMNVLADVQDACNGSFSQVLNRARSLKSALLIGAAMLNEWADQQGWDERYTPKDLGRLIHPSKLGKFSEMVTRLLYSALQAPEEGSAAGEDEGSAEKNA